MGIVLLNLAEASAFFQILSFVKHHLIIVLETPYVE